MFIEGIKRVWPPPGRLGHIIFRLWSVECGVTWEDTSSWYICLIMIISWHPILYYVGRDIAVGITGGAAFTYTIDCKSSGLELFVFSLLEGSSLFILVISPLAGPVRSDCSTPGPGDLSLFGRSLRESRLSPTLKSRPGPTLTTRAASEQTDTIL